MAFPHTAAVNHDEVVSVVGGLAGGAVLLLSGLLLVGGALKLARPRSFAHAVYRLLPKHLVRRTMLARVAPAAVGGAETLVGAGLLIAVPAPSAPWPVVMTGAAAALYVGFVAVVAVAIRVGTSCGCFSSLSDGTAGGAELGRSLVLAVLAVALLGQVVAAGTVTWWQPSAVAGLLVLAAVVVAATVIGARMRPAGAPQATSPGQAVLMVLGRVRSRLAGVELPVVPALGAAERAELLAATRRAPSVLAFESWLGDRAGEVDWRRCQIRSTAATPPGGRSVPCVLISPRCRGAMTVTVSVPTGAGAHHAVVIAVVDGRPVSVIGDRVNALPPTPADLKQN